MPSTDFSSYLARMDLVPAVLLAGFGVIVALAANRFLQNVADDVMAAGSAVGGRLARFAQRRRPAPFGSSWFCVTCHSLNAASTSTCYRGCGRRLRQDAGMAVDLETGGPSEAPAEWWVEDPRAPDR
jgi:hypothetical protein